MGFKIEWKGTGAQAKCPPDPEHPNGVNLVLARSGDRCCTTDLPYPAPGVGSHIVECTVCGLRAAVSAAGRPDDPKSLRVACLRTLH